MTFAAVLAGTRHGVFCTGRTVDPVRRAEAAGWRPVVLDTTGVTDRDAFVAVCADALDLDPAPATWEDLDARLRTLELEEPGGMLVAWVGWSELADADVDTFEMAVEVFQDACVAWADEQVPGAVLLIGPGPQTDLPQV